MTETDLRLAKQSERISFPPFLFPHEDINDFNILVRIFALLRLPLELLCEGFELSGASMRTVRPLLLLQKLQSLLL